MLAIIEPLLIGVPVIILGLIWLASLIRTRRRLAHLEKSLGDSNADTDVRDLTPAAREKLARRYSPKTQTPPPTPDPRK